MFALASPSDHKKRKRKTRKKGVQLPCREGGISGHSPLGVYMPCCMEPPGSDTGALKSATADSISSKLQLPGTIPLLGFGFSGICNIS